MSVAHLNPSSLAENPLFTQVVVVEGLHKTIYVGGQNSVDEAGNVVGENLGEQTERTLINLSHALTAADATLANIVKWTIYVVASQDVRPSIEVFQNVWPSDASPPSITVIQVPALSNPDFLVEIDAVAVIVP